MAGEFLRVEARTMQAQQDMRTKQYRAVRASGADQCEIASNNEGGPLEAVGILQNKPSSLQNAAIGYAGVSKVVCGSLVTANRLVTVQQSGEATDATSGQFAFGMALQGGNQGEVVSVLLFQPAVQLTTNSFST